MDTIVVATGNKHKVKEIGEILGARGYHVIGAKEVGDMPEVVEDGLTFLDNATKKALETARALNCTVLADDSGLEVLALNGEPGVFSARYAGEGGNDGRNVVISSNTSAATANTGMKSSVVVMPDGISFLKI